MMCAAAKCGCGFMSRRKGGPLTSLLVGEDQRVSAATRDLNHSGLLRLDERQGHRGGFQHVVIALICRGIREGSPGYTLH